MRLVISANQRSTRLSHELDVGVKWKVKRRWRRSHWLMAGVLWVEELSNTTWMSSSAGHGTVDGLQELAELGGSMLGAQAVDHLAGGEVQRGEEVSDPVALVVVGSPLELGPAASAGSGWVRSRAWMPVFSSTHSTTALSGGFR